MNELQLIVLCSLFDSNAVICTVIFLITMSVVINVMVGQTRAIFYPCQVVCQ